VLGTSLQFSDHTFIDHHAVYDPRGSDFSILLALKAKRVLSFCQPETGFLWWNHAERKTVK